MKKAKKVCTTHGPGCGGKEATCNDQFRRPPVDPVLVSREAEVFAMRMALELEAVMAQRKVTVSLLAALIHKSRQDVLQYLSGDSNVPYGEVVVAFAALGVELKMTLVPKEKA